MFVLVQYYVSSRNIMYKFDGTFYDSIKYNLDLYLNLGIIGWLNLLDD